MEFVEEDDICLDAASGLLHPFKFYLANICKEAHACDIDPQIEDKDLILKLISEDYSIKVSKVIRPNIEKLYLKYSNISSLPYEDKKFNKIYCISVLEHLDLLVLINSLKEFTRVLKDDGLIILTFDFPSVNFNFLKTALNISNLQFASKVDFNFPNDLLMSNIYPGLCCFRAVLIKQ